jgi:hypothetical protein
MARVQDGRTAVDNQPNFWLGTLQILYGIAIWAIVVMHVAMWRIFTKAGRPGWASIVPVYATIVLLRIVEKPWQLLLLLFVPLVDIFVAIHICVALARKFGRSDLFGGLGLAFCGVVFAPILATSDSKYEGSDEIDIHSRKIETLGVLLSALLISWLISAPLSLLFMLGMTVGSLFVSESSGAAHPYLVMTTAASALLFVSAIGAWKLKKLGVYGCLIASAASLLSGFLATRMVGEAASPTGAVLVGLLWPLMFVLLVRRKWHLFTSAQGSIADSSVPPTGPA